MKTLSWGLCLLALCLTAAVVMQGKTLSSLKKVASTETATSTIEAAHEILPEERQKLLDETRDLLKLRNSIRELRKEAAMLEKQKSEIEKLRAVAEDPNWKPAPLPETPPGFIGKTTLADQGLATPEAAAQTFFYAMTQGKLEQLMEASGPGFGDAKQFQKMSPEQYEHARLEMMMAMKSFQHFRIVERKDIAPDKVELVLQSSPNGPMGHMILRLIGNEWKVEKPF